MIIVDCVVYCYVIGYMVVYFFVFCLGVVFVLVVGVFV